MHVCGAHDRTRSHQPTERQRARPGGEKVRRGGIELTDQLFPNSLSTSMLNEGPGKRLFTPTTSLLAPVVPQQCGRGNAFWAG